MNWPFWPRRLTAQIAACVILALFVSQPFSGLLLLVLLPSSRPPLLVEAADRTAIVVAILDAMPAVDRAGTAAALQTPLVRIAVDGADAPATEADTSSASILRRLLEQRLGSRFTLKLARSDPSEKPRSTIVHVRLGDGEVARIELVLPESTVISLYGIGAFFFYLPFLTLALAFLSLWAARRVTAPLRAFSDAAERLGNERSASPLPEYGPLELRRAATSFNKMQEQVKRFIEDRTPALVAISHDLRTPITRLHLRVETAVENVQDRQKMLQDLNQMDSMVSSALTFLRENVQDEFVMKVDLASLLQSTCDEFSDMGYEVRYRGVPHLSVRCRPSLVSRARRERDRECNEICRFVLSRSGGRRLRQGGHSRGRRWSRDCGCREGESLSSVLPYRWSARPGFREFWSWSYDSQINR